MALRHIAVSDCSDPLCDHVLSVCQDGRASKRRRGPCELVPCMSAEDSLAALGCVTPYLLLDSSSSGGVYGGSPPPHFGSEVYRYTYSPSVFPLGRLDLTFGTYPFDTRVRLFGLLAASDLTTVVYRENAWESLVVSIQVRSATAITRLGAIVTGAPIEFVNLVHVAQSGVHFSCFSE